MVGGGMHAMIGTYDMEVTTMGDVFRAQDIRVQPSVALEVMGRDDPSEGDALPLGSAAVTRT